MDSIDLENKILEGLLDLALIAAPPVRIKHGVDFLMRDEIMIATTADHPVMAFAKPCESEPEQMWIDLKDTAPFEYILGPPSTVLGRTGRPLPARGWRGTAGTRHLPLRLFRCGDGAGGSRTRIYLPFLPHHAG